MEWPAHLPIVGGRGVSIDGHQAQPLLISGRTLHDSTAPPPPPPPPSGPTIQ